MGDHSLIGELFDGRYLIERQLGSGGMADVYLATDQSLGRKVAIKILSDRYARDAGFVERFRREASAAAGRSSHPNIVTVYDRGEAEGTSYIAMEFLDGPDAQGGDHPARAAARGRGDQLRHAGAGRARLRPPRGRDPPRHQAAQHGADRRQPAEGDRLRHRPGPEHAADDRGRARSSAPPSTSRPSRPAAWPSARSRTSTRWASCCTRCSPASCRSRATAAVDIAMKQVSDPPPPLHSETGSCRRRWSRSSCARWPRIRRCGSVGAADGRGARPRRPRPGRVAGHASRPRASSPPAMPPGSSGGRERHRRPAAAAAARAARPAPKRAAMAARAPAPDRRAAWPGSSSTTSSPATT